MNKTTELNTNKVTKTIVTTPKVYKPLGPYSQAILVDKTLYVSGLLGMSPDAQFVKGGIEAETRQALDNLGHVLAAGDASFQSVVKMTILLANMEDFPAFNKVYAEYFPRNPPARVTYEVSRLPKDAALEIEAIAISGGLVENAA